MKTRRFNGSVVLRKSLFFVHLWVGLVLGLFFVVMGLTGSIMAWQEEIFKWELRQIAQVPLPPSQGNPTMTGTPANWLALEEVITSVKKQFPHLTDKDLAGISVSTGPRDPHLFFYGFSPESGAAEARYILVDPYTGRIAGSGRIRETFIGFIVLLHTSLLLGAKGTVLSGWGSVLLVLLLVSGIWLWWPRLGSQWKPRLVVKWSASKKRIINDLHNVSGVYLFPVLFLVTITAVVMALDAPLGIRKAVYGATHTPAPAPPPKVVPPAPASAPLPLGRILQYVRDAGYEVSFVQRSLAPAQPVTCFSHVAGGPGLFENATVYLNPYNGNILRTDEERKASAGEKIMTLSHSLHFGRFGGPITQVIYTLTGLMPLSLFITGISKWATRRSAQKRNYRRQGNRIEEEELASS